jgi:uncharacterized membrane protein YraQ (UPF0718 family)
MPWNTALFNSIGEKLGLDRAFWLVMLLLVIANVGVVRAVLTNRYLALRLFGVEGRENPKRG